MGDVAQIIELLNKACIAMDREAQKHSVWYSDEMRFHMELNSWEVSRVIRNLNEIKELAGV